MYYPSYVPISDISGYNHGGMIAQEDEMLYLMQQQQQQQQQQEQLRNIHHQQQQHYGGLLPNSSYSYNDQNLVNPSMYDVQRQQQLLFNDQQQQPQQVAYINAGAPSSSRELLATSLDNDNDSIALYQRLEQQQQQRRGQYYTVDHRQPLNSGNMANQELLLEAQRMRELEEIDAQEEMRQMKLFENVYQSNQSGLAELGSQQNWHQQPFRTTSSSRMLRDEFGAELQYSDSPYMISNTTTPTRVLPPRNHVYASSTRSIDVRKHDLAQKQQQLLQSSPMMMMRRSQSVHGRIMAGKGADYEEERGVREEDSGRYATSEDEHRSRNSSSSSSSLKLKRRGRRGGSRRSRTREDRHSARTRRSKSQSTALGRSARSSRGRSSDGHDGYSRRNQTSSSSITVKRRGNSKNGRNVDRHSNRSKSRSKYDKNKHLSISSDDDEESWNKISTPAEIIDGLFEEDGWLAEATDVVKGTFNILFDKDHERNSSDDDYGSESDISDYDGRRYSRKR